MHPLHSKATAVPTSAGRLAYLVPALGALHHQPAQLAGGVERHVDQQLLVGVRLEVQAIVLPVAGFGKGARASGAQVRCMDQQLLIGVRLKVQAIVLPVTGFEKGGASK